MPIEFTPARALLDRDTTVHVVHDSNIYQVGRIGNHHVVMVTLGKIGQGDIPYVASYMYHSFPNLKHTLLVGIGGGIPDYALGQQIVLGDVVVGRQVEHLDCGRRTPNGFESTNQKYYPTPALLKTVNTLCSDHTFQETKIPHALRAIRQNVLETERQGFEDLGPEADRLSDPDYDHVDRNKSCVDCCDSRKFKTRKDRGLKAHRERDSPKIHYGIIGSGNSLVVGSKEREKLYKELGTICFEMEAAALLPSNCLVIRGISDYSDSHKNKEWQQYAAATAAAYAQELIVRLPAHAPGTSGDPNQASITNHEEPTASQDWVPSPSTQSADSVHHASELEALNEQYTQEHHKYFEPLGTSRTLLPRVPKRLYDRCQSWIERPSAPFFHIFIEAKAFDRYLYKIQLSLAARFMTMTLEEGLPLISFRCNIAIHGTLDITLDFVLQALNSQLDLYFSRERPGMRIPISKGATNLERFQASLARRAEIRFKAFKTFCPPTVAGILFQNSSSCRVGQTIV
ncbi:MAG: hypothetical protein Q9193_006231 [Seirophora villosa]